MNDVVLLTLYSVGLLTSLAGVLLLALEIRTDGRRAREIANRPVPDGFEWRNDQGQVMFTMEGLEGARQAQQHNDVAMFKDFVNDRLSGGRRWVGVVLIFIGALTGFAADVISTVTK